MSNRFHTTILVIAFVCSSILLAGCDPETFLRVQRDAETYLTSSGVLLKGVYSTPLSPLFDGIPKDISLRMELKDPHRVWIEQNGTRTELGNLTYQFPDAPVKTMILSIKDDYFLVGWIDQSVEGALDRIVFHSSGKSDRWPKSKAFAANRQMRIFHLPIYSEDGWEGIKYISIGTIEALVARDSDRQAPLYEFEIEYNPPIPWEEIDSWALPLVIDETE